MVPRPAWWAEDANGSCTARWPVKLCVSLIHRNPANLERSRVVWRDHAKAPARPAAGSAASWRAPRTASRTASPTPSPPTSDLRRGGAAPRARGSNPTTNRAGTLPPGAVPRALLGEPLCQTRRRAGRRRQGRQAATSPCPARGLPGSAGRLLVALRLAEKDGWVRRQAFDAAACAVLFSPTRKDDGGRQGCEEADRTPRQLSSAAPRSW